MIATSPRCSGGCYYFPLIAPLYLWSLLYIAECQARRHQVPFFESLAWLNLGLNPVECLPMAWETGVQSQVKSYQRLKKMVLDTCLLNTQHYKVQIKNKVEQSRERSKCPPLHLSNSSKWKESLQVTLDYGPQFYLLIYIIEKLYKLSFGSYKFISADDSIRETASSGSHYSMERKKKLYFWKDSYALKKKSGGECKSN